MKITKDDIGKKVWHKRREEWCIIYGFSKKGSVWVGYKDGFTNTYETDGRFYYDDKDVILSWEKPKKKVKKTIEIWCNLYKNDADNFCYSTKESADECCSSDRIACVKLTGEYEVEEDE